MASAPEPVPRHRVEVLRLGHRPGRDPRLTTHLALTARAFGARRMYLEPADPPLQERILAAAGRFGGDFEVQGVAHGRTLLRGRHGPSLHLTMYGEDLEEVLPRLPPSSDLLVVVGGPKVPREIYELATYNVAVTHQPHSEVAALAVTLAGLLGIPRAEHRPGAQLVVRPHPRGKDVLEVRAHRPLGEDELQRLEGPEEDA